MFLIAEAQWGDPQQPVAPKVERPQAFFLCQPRQFRLTPFFAQLAEVYDWNFYGRGLRDDLNRPAIYNPKVRAQRFGPSCNFAEGVFKSGKAQGPFEPHR